MGLIFNFAGKGCELTRFGFRSNRSNGSNPLYLLEKRGVFPIEYTPLLR